MGPLDVLLVEDETSLRLLPPLRASWAMRGTQARVAISGYNAQRVLFGVINPRTGHRVLLRRDHARQDDFCAFLEVLRQHYGRRPIWLLIDKAPCHTAIRSQKLAYQLEITLIWLPHQTPELNAMDHLWRDLKGELAANRQFSCIGELAEKAEHWLLHLTNRQSLRKAGLLSLDCWLRQFRGW